MPHAIVRSEARTARMLTRHQPEIGHELARIGKAREVAQFSDHRCRIDQRHAAHRLQCPPRRVPKGSTCLPGQVTHDTGAATPPVPSHGSGPSGIAMSISQYTARYLREAAEIATHIDQAAVDRIVEMLSTMRDHGGRLFFVGVGGGAGHAGHAVNDFRKIAGIESYTPTDNVSELTARINDDGWESSFARWLEGSRLRAGDIVFVFSVGGGDLEKHISANIIQALQLAQRVGARIVGVVGRDGGYTAKVADAVVIIPTVSADTVTPHTEAFQAVVWHLVVSHPALKRYEMKWESVV